MQQDLEALACLPDGTLSLNCLSGTATHSSVGELDLYIAKEIQAWLGHQRQKDGINLCDLKDANLLVQIKTDTIKTNRKKIICFSFDCKCDIQMADRNYSANVSETHRWHERIAP